MIDDRRRILTVKYRGPAACMDRIDEILKRHTRSAFLSAYEGNDPDGVRKLRYKIVLKDDHIPVGCIGELLRMDEILTMKWEKC